MPEKLVLFIPQASASFLGSYKLFYFHRKKNYSICTFACSVASENVKSFLNREIYGTLETFPTEYKSSFHQNSTLS